MLFLIPIWIQHSWPLVSISLVGLHHGWHLFVPFATLVRISRSLAPFTPKPTHFLTHRPKPITMAVYTASAYSFTSFMMVFVAVLPLGWFRQLSELAGAVLDSVSI